ncbi:MAG: HNH endonuclease signature motif containing protein [Caldilineaceae bacterium]|nr:HNH endonuclease signature motif containing protein [Caldilineaceae bacterium]MCY4078999.1 HNH endonuclease signature motif containing protein [Caldilineaceae bacterium]
MKPVHEIRLRHKFQEKSRSVQPDGSLIIVNKCLDCNEEQEILDLDEMIRNTTDEPETSGEEFVDHYKEIEDGFRRMSEWREQYIRLMLAGSKFNTIEDFIDTSNKRFENQFEFGDAPLYQLRKLAGIQTKNIQRKKMLLFLQGMVCNRCDSPMPTEKELEVDHIDGNRSNGSPKNLQLLCRPCHKKKHLNGNDVTSRDVSPFNYDGEPCVHPLSCVEIDRIMREYRSKQ